MPLKRATRFLGDLGSGLFGASGAALASQYPEFVQQYLQRLGGHRDEAVRLAATIKEGARPGAELFLPAIEARAAALSTALDTLSHASGVERLAVFVRHIDRDIAEATLAAFRPAVPLTLEGIVAATIGLLLGVAIFGMMAAPFRSWRARRQSYAGAARR